MERCIISSAARRSPFTLGRTADRTRSERRRWLPRRGAVTVGRRSPVAPDAGGLGAGTAGAGAAGRSGFRGGGGRGRGAIEGQALSEDAAGDVGRQLRGWQPPPVGFGGSLGSRRRIARTPPSTRRRRPRCRSCRPLPDQAAGDRGGRRTRRERWRWLSPATCTRGWCLPGRTHDS
jgi:hypothetical protein